MCAKWRNETYDIQVILDKIAANISLHAKNVIAYSTDFNFHQRYRPTLVSAVCFHEDVPSIEKEGIVMSGLVYALEKGGITPETVIAGIRAAERDFLRKKNDEFVLVTSISFREMPPFRTISGMGTKIILSKSLPRKYQRNEPEQEMLRFVPGALPTDYVAVQAQTSGRTVAEAAARALDSLSLLVGIWNFLATRRIKKFNFDQRTTGAVADIRLGPLHTLHHPDGTLATEIFWFDSDYTKPAEPPVTRGRDLKVLRHFERWILRRIEKAEYGDWLRDGFRKYASAVGESKLENAFLRFWALLEYLTDTGKDSFDTTISRVAATYEDSGFIRQELQHLRDVRNNLVHLRESSEDPQSHVYQVKKYVDEFFALLLQDVYLKKSLRNVVKLLDLPTGLADLRREHDALVHKQKLYKEAIRIRTSRPSATAYPAKRSNGHWR